MKRGTIIFPHRFERNGRTGKIYKLGNGTFKTYFLFAGQPRQNTHGSFPSACEFLEAEFSKLDTDQANSLSLAPLNGSVRTYAELEGLLREKGDGATLREAVNYYLTHYRSKKLTPLTFKECGDRFVKSQQNDGNSPGQIATLKKHFKRFGRDFDSRKIHEITSLEITEWLNSQTDEKTGQPWSAKTRISNLGSLVSLSLFARKILKAIPDVGETEFQAVKRPKKEQMEAVEIYTPDELAKLLRAAIETDIDMIPVLVLGGLQGLRPAEVHGEKVKRPPAAFVEWPPSVPSHPRPEGVPCPLFAGRLGT
jgi:hypothetical protein